MESFWEFYPKAMLLLDKEEKMNIGILTSGGDAPGMNAFISKFVNLNQKDKIIAFKFGYQGLIDNTTIKLDKNTVLNCSHLGGSIIKSSRCSEFMTKKGLAKAITNLKLNKISTLVILGGEGTLKGAKELSKNGIDVIFVPTTIDNDLSYTQRTLGFDSAVNACVDTVDKIKQTMLSLNRIFICEVMGRHCPDIATDTFFATDSTCLITNKSDYNFKELISCLKTAIKNGEESPSIIIRENILDVFKLAKEIQNELDIETRACKIGYVQRGCQPSVIDRILARKFAICAMDLISKKQSNLALCCNDDNIDVQEILKI